MENSIINIEEYSIDLKKVNPYSFFEKNTDSKMLRGEVIEKVVNNLNKVLYDFTPNEVILKFFKAGYYFLELKHTIYNKNEMLDYKNFILIKKDEFKEHPEKICELEKFETFLDTFFKQKKNLGLDIKPYLFYLLTNSRDLFVFYEMYMRLEYDPKTIQRQNPIEHTLKELGFRNETSLNFYGYDLALFKQFFSEKEITYLHSFGIELNGNLIDLFKDLEDMYENEEDLYGNRLDRDDLIFIENLLDIKIYPLKKKVNSDIQKLDAQKYLFKNSKKELRGYEDTNISSYEFIKEEIGEYLDLLNNFKSYLSRYTESELDLFTRQSRNLLVGYYKIHLMPNKENYIRTLTTLVLLWEKFKLPMYSFKIHKGTYNKELLAETSDYLPSIKKKKKLIFASIVIYPFYGKENLITILECLNKYTKPEWGSGITPRYNIKLNDLIYYAGGDGDVKTVMESYSHLKSLNIFKEDLTLFSENTEVKLNHL